MNETNNRSLVVTLDGPAGAGKTTMARYLAWALDDTVYLDTGAIYRTIALAAVRAGYDGTYGPEILDAVVNSNPDIRIEKLADGNFRQDMYLDGILIPDRDLRPARISEASSSISVHKEIRGMANAMARRAAGDHLLIVDGRDAGTAIFPDAVLKFFLWATLEERAERRKNQEREAGKDRDLAVIIEEMRIRDERDSTRAEDPLKYPPDAIWIDTGAFLEEGVQRFLRDAIKARLDPAAAPII